jgi:hypothetical protein
LIGGVVVSTDRRLDRRLNRCFFVGFGLVSGRCLLLFGLRLVSRFVLPLLRFFGGLLLGIAVRHRASDCTASGANERTCRDVAEVITGYQPNQGANTGSFPGPVTDALCLTRGRRADQKNHDGS